MIKTTTPLLLCLILAGCGGGGGSSSDSTDTSSNNSSNTSESTNESSGDSTDTDSGSDSTDTDSSDSDSTDTSGSNDTDSGSEDSTSEDSDTGSDTDTGTEPEQEPETEPEPEEEVSSTTSGWIINNGNERSTYIFESSNTSTGVLVNVESVENTTESGVEYTKVVASGIPDYVIEITQDQVDWLNSRPKASSGDFGGSSSTTAVAGDSIAYGESIGYRSSNQNCPTTGGDGYWPPGPSCPTDQSKEGYFPNNPVPASAECETGLGAIGYMVNGTSIYNWSDGTSYNDQNIWQLNAPVAEQYDVDICGGHAQQEGDYHHHFTSSCLDELVSDDGSQHSPLVGYAADGYPVYGKWHVQGVLAKPSWQKRDYSDVSSSSTGCPGGAAGERSCTLVDQFDVSKGVTDLSGTEGPDTDDTYTTQSGNPVSAASGLFYEDYYYDSDLYGSSPEYLDQHNGHDHDGLGYHYHVTVESDESTPAFPYIVGPEFYGEINDNAVSDCSTGSPAQGGPDQGGSGQDGPPPPKN